MDQRNKTLLSDCFTLVTFKSTDTPPRKHPDFVWMQQKCTLCPAPCLPLRLSNRHTDQQLMTEATMQLGSRPYTIIHWALYTHRLKVDAQKCPKTIKILRKYDNIVRGQRLCRYRHTLVVRHQWWWSESMFFFLRKTASVSLQKWLMEEEEEEEEVEEEEEEICWSWFRTLLGIELNHNFDTRLQSLLLTSQSFLCGCSWPFILSISLSEYNKLILLTSSSSFVPSKQLPYFDTV